MVKHPDTRCRSGMCLPGIILVAVSLTLILAGCWSVVPAPASTANPEVLAAAAQTAQAAAQLAPAAGVPTSTQIAERTTPSAFVTLPGVRIITFTPSPTFGPARVVLFYDENQLTLLNNSGEVIDISDMELVSAGGYTLKVTDWQSQTLAAPLNAFPHGHCLQIYETNKPDQGQILECDERDAVLYLAPQDMFWKDVDFDVEIDGEVITTCAAGGNQCEVLLP